MTLAAENARITLNNILYLTDFSEPSEAALPFAVAIARDYGARVHALHVLTPVILESYPEAIHADENLAAAEMARLNRKLAGVSHDTAIAHGLELWPAVERAVREQQIDLIVLGTHGRTRARKLLLGSFAEEIFRRSNIPVLTIGPNVQNLAVGGAFQSILFATDFSNPSKAAGPFAVSLAEENDARLIVLYVSPNDRTGVGSDRELADIIHKLNDVVPTDARRWCRPSPIVQYGDPADRILEVASEHGVDLIVLGVRGAVGHMGAAIHLERATAHKIVSHAQCPVLTVRG